MCVYYLVLPAGYPRAYPGQGPASTGAPPAADPLLACRPLSGALSCALPSGEPAPLLEVWSVPPQAPSVDGGAQIESIYVS